MTRRYYHPDLPADGGPVTLLETESQHAIKVMRVQIDDEIELFDGRGNVATAVVSAVRRRDCECQAEAVLAVDREPARGLHLGIALPKPDRAREMAERLTELGVKSITPLMTARTQRPPAAKLIDKLRRGSIEACKQSGRNVLLDINEPMTATEYFATSNKQLVRWIAHPAGSPITAHQNAGKIIIAAIGPEGGWSDDEVTTAKTQGFQTIGFGKRILRIETAAAFLAARLLD